MFRDYLIGLQIGSLWDFSYLFLPLLFVGLGRPLIIGRILPKQRLFGFTATALFVDLLLEVNLTATLVLLCIEGVVLLLGNLARFAQRTVMQRIRRILTQTLLALLPTVLHRILLLRQLLSARLLDRPRLTQSLDVGLSEEVNDRLVFNSV
jgi:hypothetical protein